MELDGHVLRAFHFKNAHGLVILVVVDLGVGRVVRDDHVVLPADADELFVECARGRGRRGIVGIVDEDHLRPVPGGGGNGVEVGQVVVFLHQGDELHLAAHEAGGNVVHRIVGGAHQHQVTGVHEGQRKVRDAFLGPDEADDLGLGVKADAEAAAIPVGHFLPEFQHAHVRGVLVVGRALHGLLHGLDDEIGRRHVGIADAEADDVHATGGHFGLDLVDACEQVRGQGRQPVRESEISHSESSPCGFRSPQRALSPVAWHAAAPVKKEGSARSPFLAMPFG